MEINCKKEIENTTNTNTTSNTSTILPLVVNRKSKRAQSPIKVKPHVMKDLMGDSILARTLSLSAAHNVIVNRNRSGIYAHPIQRGDKLSTALPKTNIGSKQSNGNNNGNSAHGNNQNDNTNINNANNFNADNTTATCISANNSNTAVIPAPNRNIIASNSSSKNKIDKNAQKILKHNQAYIKNSCTKSNSKETNSTGVHSYYRDSNNQNHNSHYNNLPLAAILKPRRQIADVISATPRLDETNTIQAKTLSTRAKNDEAIDDLRTRIPEIESIFDVHSRIGNGTFSTVLLGTLKKERQMPENLRRKFAIKHHIPTSHPDRIMKELQCMAKMGGVENVVGVNCCIRYNESVAFIMPYMQHDRFNDFFYRMDLNEIKLYMKNLLIALRHVHKFNVIHRDVKPSNFLYNRRKRQFLLVDFGLAQQVLMPSTKAALTALAFAAGHTASQAEGKRLREQDDQPNVKGKDAAADDHSMPYISGSAKRLRCSGTINGEHQLKALPSSVTTGTSGMSRGTNAVQTFAQVTRSLNIVNGTPFKMPLKQLNEISAPGKVSQSSTNNVTYETSMNSTNVSSRLHQKIRAHHRLSGGSKNGAESLSFTDATQVRMSGGMGAFDSVNPKYNANRQLSINSSTAKCFCYGNPQVCNGCLIKKEIHASRAGTPGYRPPEVLLKYPDQTTAVDIWAAGVIFLSILSSVYPFFKAPNDYVALAEMVTIFGDKSIRKTAFLLDRLVTLSQKTKPLNLRKLSVRFRNRSKFSSPDLLRKYQRSDGSCEVCKNCDQFYFNCLCSETNYNTEPLDADDLFPASAYDLLNRLLEVNPHKRITADEALVHPFFSDIVKSEPNATTRVAAHAAVTQSDNDASKKERFTSIGIE